MVGYGWRDRTVNTRHGLQATWLDMVGGIGQSIPDMVHRQHGWIWLDRIGVIVQSIPVPDMVKNLVEQKNSFQPMNASTNKIQIS